MRNEIVLAGDSLYDDKITSGDVYQITSLDGNELQFDTLSATVNIGVQHPTGFVPSDSDGLLTADEELFGVRPMVYLLSSDPTLYKYGSEVVYRHKGVLVGKYYMNKLKRVGKEQYKIECVSPVGLLAGSQHYGGIYTGGITFSALLTDIIGGLVPFTVSSELENQLVYGWLPVATRRDNLHQALFAMGAAARKDENGDLYFAPLSDETHAEIPDGRVYVSGSVIYPDEVTKVSVSEHAYALSEADEVVTLFEGLVESATITTPNGTATQGSVILFDSPMHDLVVENGEIVESGVNYAVLAPATEVKLTGKKYTHIVREITRSETAEKGTGTENNITVTDATLISIANSENVADRLMSYHSSAKIVSVDIVLDGEKSGDAVQLTDPFGEVTKGIIKSLDITMSNTLKAHAEIVADYSPGGAGNYYTNVDVVSESGEWVVPAGVKKIRVVLIGGGSGGSSGANGADGEGGNTGGSAGTYKGGTGGSGGAAGDGGDGGRIYVTSISVSEGDVFSVAIGEGGSGGVCDGTESVYGASGTDTTFGDYTSADGFKSATGYAELFGGVVYAVPGTAGIKGSNGVGQGVDGATASDTITIDGVEYICGATGSQSAAHWSGNGRSGTVVPKGGFGGGAAVGANGETGSNASASKFANEAVGFGGDGGNGGSATVPGAAGTQYGSGGHGGHGGGGGGAGAGGVAIGYSVGIVGGSGGAGGNGSNGGNGAQGCVLVYH